MGIMAPFEWASAKLSYGAGSVVSFFGAKRTGEFLKMMGDNTYVPEEYRKGIATDEEMQTLSQEEMLARIEKAKQETKEASEAYASIAKNMETGLATTGQVLTGTGGALVGGFTGGPGGAVMGATIGAEAFESAADAYMGPNEAPVRSLRRRFGVSDEHGKVANAALEGLSWVGADIREDPHYAKDGSPETHPELMERREKMKKITEDATRKAYAEHGLKPDGTPLNEPASPAAASTAPAEEKSSGLLGIGLMAGVAALGLGAIGFLAGGGVTAGMLLAGVGALVGTTVGRPALEAAYSYFTGPEKTPASSPADPAVKQPASTGEQKEQPDVTPAKTPVVKTQQPAQAQGR